MNYFSGAGIGLIVGLLLALSVSSVVGPVVTSIAALLAAYFGLTSIDTTNNIPTDQAEKNGYRLRISNQRIGSFGFACVIGILIGIFLRTHNLLGISVSDKYENWVKIGVEPVVARSLTIYEETGIIDDKIKLQSIASPQAKPESNLREQTILFRAEEEDCDRLLPSRYGSTMDIIKVWQESRGKWEELANTVQEKYPESQQRKILDAYWQLICLQTNDQ